MTKQRPRRPAPHVPTPPPWPVLVLTDGGEVLVDTSDPRQRGATIDMRT